MTILFRQPTADGSFTFFSEEFGEAFHSYSGAKQEAQQKFVRPCQLAELSQTGSLRLLDICYGLGYNSAAALATVWSVNPACYVELVALEADWAVPHQAIAHNLLSGWEPSIFQSLKELANIGQVHTKQLNAQLLIGDARQTIQQVYQWEWQADAVFLDPFSPPKCPQLWTVEFLGLVAQCLAPTGRLATYSCAASVRTALKLARLNVGSTTGVGRKAPGTVARFINSDILPLSRQEQEHLLTRAAIPYRDRQLDDSPENIRQRRQQEQQASLLEPTSRWKKRWSSSI